MAIDKIQSESMNLADTFAFTGTVTGAGGVNTPAFSAYMSSNQSIANTTATTVAFNAENFDVGSDFNTSTYKWTVPETAKYLINVRIAFEGTGDFAMYWSIVKDGVGDMFSLNMAHRDTNDGIAGCVIKDLSANDVYYVQVRQASGDALNAIGGNQLSEFSAFKLIE